MSKTEEAYRTAEGRCLTAMVALRRFSGAEALEQLKLAIRTIEAEQVRARREDRVNWNRVQPAAPPSPMDPMDF